MELPLQITFHGLERSEAINEKVRERAQRLDKYFDSIQSCRVAIEAPHRHHAKGNQYRVRIEVAVPGQQLVVTRAADEEGSHADVYVAIRDAFDTMRRRLEDYSAVLRGDVKEHRGSQGEAT
jgi:ribosomal subunit interface protein